MLAGLLVEGDGHIIDNLNSSAMSYNISMLPEDLGEIVALMSGVAPSPRYVLADGRTVPGTRYEAYIGSTVPDLRGCYLRGKNYDRAMSSGNAAGDLPLGTYQTHAFSNHAHTYIRMVANNYIDGVDSAAPPGNGDHHSEYALTRTSVGKETAPNSITVAFFICVD